MPRRPAITVGDIEGPWTDPDIQTGLIRRCHDSWNVPVTELSNLMLATYLNQQLGLRLVTPEARKRLEAMVVDGTELYPEHLANALQRATGEPYPAAAVVRPRRSRYIRPESRSRRAGH